MNAPSARQPPHTNLSATSPARSESACSDGIDGLLPFENYAREAWEVYLVFALGGWLGMHRYLLGRWKTGLLYSVTFGLCGVGWLVDAFFLKKMLADENERLYRLYQSEPELFATPTPQWARELAQKRPSFWGLFGVSLFHMFAPGVFVYQCFKHQRISFMLLVFFLLILGYTGASVNSLQRMFPGILNIPGLGSILKRLLSLDLFYRQHKPGRLLYYLFYPITAPIAMLRSSAARSEFAMLSVWLGAIALFSVGEIALLYCDAFPPYLGPLDAWDLLLVELALVSALFFGCIMPMVTTHHRLHYTGLQSIKWQFTVVAMISFGTVLGVLRDDKTERPKLPVFEQQLLQKKLTKTAYQDAIQAANAQLKRQFKRLKKARQTAKPNASSAAAGALAPQLTKAYQARLTATMDRAEARGFRIYRLPHKGRSWLAVLLDFDYGEPRWLFVLSAQGEWLTRWAALPAPITQGLEATTHRVLYPQSKVPPSNDKTTASHKLRLRALWGDREGAGRAM